MIAIAKTQKPAPAGSVAVQRPKAIIWKVDDYLDPWHDHLRLYRYDSATDATGHVNFEQIDLPANERRYRDEEALADETEYWVRWSAIDIYGNESELSTAVSETNRRIIASDTDATALAAPSGLALALNYQAVDAGDGAVNTTYKATWSLLAGAVRYELELSQSDTLGGTYTVIDNIMTTALLVSFKVIVGKFYKARLRGFNAFGKDGAWSAPTAAISPTAVGAPSTPVNLVVVPLQLGVTVSWDACPDPDYAYTEIVWFGSPLTIPTISTAAKAFGVQYGTGTVGSLNIYLGFGSTSASYFWIRHVNNSGGKSAWAMQDNNSNGNPDPIIPSFIQTGNLENKAVTTYTLDDSSVGPTQLKPNSASIWEKSNPVGGVTVPATTTADVITCTSNHTADATDVEVSGQFKNSTGASRTVDIIFRAGSTDILTISAVTLVDQEWWSGSFFFSSLSGVSTNFSIRVTAGATAFTANNRTMTCKARKR